VNASTILASTIITPSISTNNISTIRLSVSSINSHLIPAVDNTYDLGSAISKWRDLYVGGTSIHLGNQLVLSEDSSGRLSTNQIIFTPGLDIDNKEITNVLQTTSLNSATTNVMARRVYFDSIATFDIDDTTFSNVLTTTQANPPIYNNPNKFYTYLNCTFSFRGDGVNDTLAYYFELSNITQPLLANLQGKIFNDAYPFIENSKLLFTNNHSITVQEQFNSVAAAWANGDTFLPLMFVRSKTGTPTLTNMEFSMVYEPLIEFFP
jgi:hypothetical protein